MKLFRATLLLAIFLISSATLLAQDQQAAPPPKQDLPTQEKQSVMTTQEAAEATRIPRNSKVYIAPMNGYETYLAAALRKKEVPLVVVNEPEYADFKITGTSETKKAGWAKTIFMGDARSSNSASIQVINIRTTVVAYADSSHRGSSNRGDRSTAEKLAKYLKKKIEDDEKKAAGKK